MSLNEVVEMRTMFSGSRFVVNELDVCESLMRHVRKLQGEDDIREEDSKWLEMLEQQTDADVQPCLDMVLNSADKIYSNDKDQSHIEFIFNAMISIINYISEQHYTDTIERLSMIFISQKQQQHAELNIRLLCLLFNTIPENHTIRSKVMQRLLDLVRESHITLSKLLRGKLKNLKNWIKLWKLNINERKNIYYSASKVSSRAGDSEQSQEFLIEYLKQWNENDNINDDLIAEASQAVIAAISNEKINTKIVMELSNCYVVKIMSKHEKYKNLYELLNIIYQGTITDFIKFHDKYQDYIKSLGLEIDDLKPKITLLTLCSIGNYKPLISFNDLKNELHLNSIEEIEELVINAVKDGIIQAKIDHSEQILFISKSIQRVFNQGSWNLLTDRLSLWQQNTQTVLQIIHSAGVRSYYQQMAAEENQ